MNRRRILLVAAGLAAATAGCSSVRVNKVLDAKETARQISQNLGTTFGLSNPAVFCPGGVQVTAGAKFDCTTTLEAQPLTIHVILNDDQGRFTPTTGEAVLLVSKIATAIKSDPTQSSSATVTCGDHTVLVKQPGDSFPCAVTTGTANQTVDITVKDLNGNISYQLAGASASQATPATTAPPTSG
jgi:hypothetical protein